MRKFRWHLPESCWLILCFASPAVQAGESPGMPAQIAQGSPANAAATAAAGKPAETTPAGDNANTSYLSVRLNGREIPELWRVLQPKPGRILMAAEDLRRWRIRLPANAAAQVAADDLPGLRAQIDTARQELQLQVDPALFEAQRFTLTQEPVAALSPQATVGFLNYDLLAQRNGTMDALTGMVELGLFSRLGVATSTHLGQDIDGQRRSIRLDTTLTQDRPGERSSLRFGDALTRPGAGGLVTRFAGVQWATNFSTQPGFLPYPLPEFRGEASVPSTVDVFVNNALGARGQVQQGPFEITRLPVITGQGEVRLVQRDFLGREVTRVVPYYVSPQLLRSGLSDFSYQAGFLRENYGSSSADYGSAFVSALHRHGWTDRFTGELRGELQAQQQTLALGGSYLYRELGSFGGTLAMSRSEFGSGQMAQLRAERLTRQLSLGMSMQMASEEYTQLGSSRIAAATRNLHTINAGHPLGNGSLGVSYTAQERRDGMTVRIVTASYSLRLPGSFSLTMSALHSNGGGASNSSVGLTLNRSLGDRSNVAGNLTRQPGRSEAITQFQQNLPTGNGTAFRALAAGIDASRAEVGMSMQTSAALFNIDAAHNGKVDTLRLGAAGGIATMGGDFFFTRRLEDSFAVVEVPRYAGVSVYQNNQLVARTDQSGRALLPRLLPYQDNRIRIESHELPLDTEIGALEITASPYYRSGTLARFDIRAGSGALLVLVDEEGNTLPEGAAIRIGDGGEVYFAARRGEVYLRGLADGDRIQARWPQGGCDATVLLETSDEPVPRIGPVICRKTL